MVFFLRHSFKTRPKTKDGGNSHMRRLKKVISAFLSLFLLAVCPIYGEEPALAAEIQPRLNMGFYWHNTPRTVYLDISNLPSSFQTEAVGAMNIWNKVRSLNGKKMVTFAKGTYGNTFSNISYTAIDNRYIGYTKHYYSGNALSSVTIYLNSSKPLTVGPNPNSYDVKTVLVHELGHALGIAHCHEIGSSCFSPTCSINVMNPETPVNETRTVLRAYDTSSYQMIYS